MSKKIIAFAVILLSLVLAVVCYWKVPGMQEKVAAIIEEDFSEENIYSDLEGLSERLDAEILEGNESFTIYLKDMDVDEINQINSSLNGIFGSGATYQQVGKIGDTYKKVMITINRTTNYYRLLAYLENSPIPEGEEQAEELYAVIKEIMDTEITPNMSDYEKELALHDYVVAHCEYTEEAEESTDSEIYRAYAVSKS